MSVPCWWTSKKPNKKDYLAVKSSASCVCDTVQSLLHHHLYFFKFKELKRKTAHFLLNYSKVFLQNIAGRVSVAKLKYIEIFIVFKA